MCQLSWNYFKELSVTGRNKQSPPLRLGDRTEQLPARLLVGVEAVTHPPVCESGVRECAVKKRSHFPCMGFQVEGQVCPRLQQMTGVRMPVFHFPGLGSGLLQDSGETSGIPGSNEWRWDRGLAFWKKIIKFLHSLYQTKFQWIKNLNINHENMRVLEETRVKLFCHPGMGQPFSADSSL